MCSFDIQSLFTNIPLDKTIDIICNAVFQNTGLFHNFPKTEFLALLNFAAKNSLFLFNKINYVQTAGCSMGSSVAAKCVIFYWLTIRRNGRAMPKLRQPRFRYANDTLTIFDSPDHATKFLDCLNHLPSKQNIMQHCPCWTA